MKSDEEKQATVDARNKRRRDARAKAKVEGEVSEGMVDVSALTPGDIFTLDEVKYIVLSIDSPSNHIHTNLLEEEETFGTHGSVDFGTKVNVIAKAKIKMKKEEAVVLTSVPVAPATPAVSGGRWYN